MTSFTKGKYYQTFGQNEPKMIFNAEIHETIQKIKESVYKII